MNSIFFFFSPRIWFYSDINSTSHSGPESPHVLDRAALDSLPCRMCHNGCMLRYLLNMYIQRIHLLVGLDWFCWWWWSIG